LGSPHALAKASSAPVQNPPSRNPWSDARRACTPDVSESRTDRGTR
jgi:hypothetical protein